MPTLNRAMSNRNGNFHSLDREQRRSPKHSPWKREGIMSEDEMTVEDSDRDSIETATETDADCIEGLQELSNGVGERMSSLLERVNEKSFHVSLKIESSMKNPKEKAKTNARPFYIWNEPVPLPDSPCFACVGRIITETPEGCNVQKGERVAAMVSAEEDFDCYAKVKVTDVINMPDDIDACMALVLMTTYMAAYQSLSVGQNTLKGKKVLINGGVGPVCQASIELALLGGARVFVPALREYHSFISGLGAKPIDCHPQDWTIQDGSMDLVIDAICSDELKTPQRKTASDGKLVSIGLSAMDACSSDDDFLSQFERFWFHNTASFTTRATFYGLMRSWESERETYERDLNHLFYLFSKKKISPKISAYASLEEYPKLRSGMKGTVVCVPCQE
mmetsp:Transcript_9832/g.29262  ORF Transcript_9832/g.29262 Transcript_9832/m.29262 type:complete len:392 (-) Transcript_9832:219-1394(-)|eukprot:CAMPEP_0113535570 /NCGR_PEP_ID=MMETSP0015_2-20120614/5781_1 /TAXON_ID=2838 /ORGANISM="Odontella" /LENGTH=391 /DNA_ID=CAMNT_0000434843 /DNA_START=417 /DNA_END=1592 /DNA_ORIENTATION=+ /assembly_acc=CAM_ASM_000160